MIDERILEQHIAVLGKNGSGKTFATKAVIVEPLLDAGRLVAVVDPTSAWWGLRSSADGKGAGYKVLVLGGDHGDLPLPATGGAAVAKLIVEQRVPCVLDTGNLTVGQRTRWMIDFAGELYRINRSPLYLVVDEAHVFAPQGKVPDPDTGRMLHAFNQIAAGGRSRGIRLTMLTQRPQKLHKDALTTADTLIAMRVLAPQDRAAVKDWIDGCGDPAQGKQVLDSLAQLQRGEGWLWYPEGGVLERMKFPRIRTFDSSATPTHGHQAQEPRVAAAIDLSSIEAALADAAREAAENDPKRLRARIAELEKRKPGASDEELREQFTRGHTAGYAFALDALRQAADQGLEQIRTAVESFFNAARQVGAPPRAAVEPARREISHVRETRAAPEQRGNGAGEVDKPMPRAILTALAQHPDGLTKGQILVHTGYRSSGPVSRCFAELLRNAWVSSSGSRLMITPSGLAALGQYEPLPTGAALRAHLLNGSKCTGMEKAMLQVLFEHYPQPVAKGEILKATRYAASGPVSRAFARLVALGYAVQSGRGTLRAGADLF